MFYLRISSFYNKREWHPFRGGRSINLDNRNMERPLGTGRQIEIKDLRRPCKEKKKRLKETATYQDYWNTIIPQVAPLLWPRKGKAFFFYHRKERLFFWDHRKGKALSWRKIFAKLQHGTSPLSMATRIGRLMLPTIPIMIAVASGSCPPRERTAVPATTPALYFINFFIVERIFFIKISIPIIFLSKSFFSNNMEGETFYNENFRAYSFWYCFYLFLKDQNWFSVSNVPVVEAVVEWIIF